MLKKLPHPLKFLVLFLYFFINNSEIFASSSIDSTDLFFNGKTITHKECLALEPLNLIGEKGNGSAQSWQECFSKTASTIENSKDISSILSKTGLSIPTYQTRANTLQPFDEFVRLVKEHLEKKSLSVETQIEATFIILTAQLGDTPLDAEKKDQMRKEVTNAHNSGSPNPYSPQKTKKIANGVSNIVHQEKIKEIDSLKEQLFQQYLSLQESLSKIKTLEEEIQGQIILVESLTNKKSFLEEENVNLLDTNKDLQTEIEALSQRLEPLTLSLQEESQKNGSLNEENLKLKGALRRYTKHKKTQRNKDEKTQLFLKNRIIEIGSLLRKTLEKKEVVKKTLSEENISLKTQLKSKEEELEKSLSVIEQQEKNILQLEFQKLCLKVGRNVSNPHRLFLDTLKKSPTLWTQKLNKNTLKPKL